jgi:preprotein translocase subunit SecG
MINTVMAIGGSIFIVTLVIIQKSKYEDIGVSGDSEHYVKVFNELINEQ